MIPTIDVPSEEAQVAAVAVSEDASAYSASIKREPDGREIEARLDHLRCSLQSAKMTDEPIASRDSLDEVAIADEELVEPKLVEKSVIIHKDEYGFGLRVKGQAPTFVEHVHENGAAWRAGVRRFDVISKINGTPIACMDHKEVVLMFKSCTRFVGLTLLSSVAASLSVAIAADPSESGELDLLGNDGDELSSLSFNSRLRVPLALDKIRSSSQGCSPSSSRANPLGFGAGNHTHVISHHAQPPQKQSLISTSIKQIPNLQLVGAGDLQGGSESPENPVDARLRSTQTLPVAAPRPLSRQLTRQEIKAESCARRLSQSASTNSLPCNGADGQTKYQSIGLTGMGGTPSAKPKVNERLEIVREFVDTERTHTERLRHLDELFYRPIKAANLMTSEQLRQVFSCHRTLYKIHRQIYRTLLSASYNVSSEPLIGSALLEIFEGDLRRRLERAACTFCSAQSVNSDLLNKLTRRDTKIGEFIAQVTSQQMIGRLGIKDLLASCFQRITKYPLLLQNLLKATPKPQPFNYSTDVRSENSCRCADSPDRQHPDSAPGPESDCPFDVGFNCGHQSELDLEMARNSQRMFAISLEEEREFIERALNQSRQILVRVNESVNVAISQRKLKEIWKRTDKYPGVPLIDITKQQVVHEGLLTLRLSKRSFDVYVLLLNDYLIILTREGQDKYRLKFFTSDGKSAPPPNPSSCSSAAGSQQQSVYSPVFVIDEHLTTRDAATDENGFYLLCKRKDDSRIYEFASRSPSERSKWRESIQWTIDRQLSRTDRRPSCVSTITKSSSEISARRDLDDSELDYPPAPRQLQSSSGDDRLANGLGAETSDKMDESPVRKTASGNDERDREPTKIEGSISYVEDDGIVMPSNMGSSRAFVDRAVQVSVFADQAQVSKPIMLN